MPSEREEGNSPMARALRRAGYRRCHRWWLTPEQFELVAYLAHQNEEAVLAIKQTVRRNE